MDEWDDFLFNPIREKYWMQKDLENYVLDDLFNINEIITVDKINEFKRNKIEEQQININRR